jgi:5-(carboxyamino)imidazole ribonucleotide synthase
MTVGILGGGQLGRMLALAGYPLGLRFRFLDTSAQAPAGHLAELHVGNYEDSAVLARFAEGLEVVTYEFENVPVGAAHLLAERLPVYPPPKALEAAQDRLVEKTFFRDLGIPTPPFMPVDSESDFHSALASVGLPAVLKTRRLGYDGKGQLVLRDAREAEFAWQVLGAVPQILEGFVPFEREVSILAVRGQDGQTACYPLVENQHREGMLRISRVSASGKDIDNSLQEQANTYARKVQAALDYVGVLAIEFFESRGRLLANEMAPRVHNSGHWTIEGAVCSQFENHLRAITGLPLGSTEVCGHVAMVNLIGRLPSITSLLMIPGAHVHLYGKTAMPGRKLGHVTLVEKDAGLLQDRLSELQRLTEEA